MLLLRGASLKSLPALAAVGAPIWAVVAAATAAVGAIVALIDQLGKLSAETEGLGLTGIIDQMVKRGTLDPFEAVDAFQNEQARKRSQSIPAGGRSGQTNNNQRINQENRFEINVPPGTSPEMAREMSRETARLLGDANRATQAALTPAG
jgi:hypothetical protein